MDYVQWVERVMQAILTAWNSADEDTRYIGVELQSVADALGLSVDTRAPEFEKSSLAKALNCAFKDLEDLGWDEEVAYRTHRPTPVGRTLPADPGAIWESIIGESRLDDDQVALLAATTMLAQEQLPDHAYLKSVTGKEAFAAAGWPWQAAKAVRLAMELENLGVIRAHIPLGENIDLIPTYGGIVRTSRQVESKWGKLLRELVADWENTNVDFKRELNLKKDREKAEFVRDILSLATTLTRGQRFLIIGFDDETRDFYASVDDSITQERLEQILTAYTKPVPKISYVRVPYKTGTVGVVEVFQDKKHLPYSAKGVGRLDKGSVFVRHSSHTEPPTDDERGAIEDEGRRARGEV